MNLPINMRIIKYKIWKILQKSMYATFKRNAPKRVLAIFPNSNSAEYLNQIKDISEIDRKIIGRYCGSLEDKVMQTMSCFDIAQKFPSDSKYGSSLFPMKNQKKQALEGLSSNLRFDLLYVFSPLLVFRKFPSEIN